MKQLHKLFLFICIIGIAEVIQAQSLFMSTYVERTSVSPKFGTQAGVSFLGGFEAGTFYQSESLLQGEEGRSAYEAEQEFFGVFFTGPLTSGEKFNLLLNVRTGAVNKVNFSITPALLANYKPFRLIQIQAGMGVRNLRPTAIAGLKFNFN